MTQVGQDPDAVVADAYLQTAGSRRFSGVRLRGDKGARRTASVTGRVVDEFANASGDLRTWRRTKVGDSKQAYALTYSVRGAWGEQRGLKKSRVAIATIVERNCPDDSCALGKPGEEVHTLQVRGYATIGGETRNALARHDRSGLRERRHDGEV
ncbi:hypothetical protein J8N05_20750 [Streptomyces sp. BH-SS-21]|uniref:Uncharacterized protein n=1 Tax=Streptomyces liliiviolaceus TaxID=2823109 RepID=A0A940XVV0_9ACTN|nr:hypothetical protein [Streptomyces liliiviolaceus]MBQ0850598.1 hypothetical protein [Streptomyces liliiviolaceus]